MVQPPPDVCKGGPAVLHLCGPALPPASLRDAVTTGAYAAARRGRQDRALVLAGIAPGQVHELSSLLIRMPRITSWISAAMRTP
jgi:hypothetical protein